MGLSPKPQALEALGAHTVQGLHQSRVRNVRLVGLEFFFEVGRELREVEDLPRRLELQVPDVPELPFQRGTPGEHPEDVLDQQLALVAELVAEPEQLEFVVRLDEQPLRDGDAVRRDVSLQELPELHDRDDVQLAALQLRDEVALDLLEEEVDHDERLLLVLDQTVCEGRPGGRQVVVGRGD